MNALLVSAIQAVHLHVDAVRRRTGAHVRFDYRLNPPVETESLTAAEESMRTTLPEELRQFYLGYADGLSFSWQADSYGANLKFPTLKTLVRLRKPYIRYWIAECDPSELSVSDRVLAAETAQRMKAWLPVFEEPNGDQICLDLANRKIVYNQHDWFDAGSGANGHVMAEDVTRFLDEWSIVCFMIPTTLHWSDAFNRRGVSWTARHFDKTFIRR